MVARPGRSCSGQARHVRSCFLLLSLTMLAVSAYADVYVMTDTYNLPEPLAALPADFGPPLFDEGIEGQLKAAVPADACTPLLFQDYETVWIALIARQQQPVLDPTCTFDIKVRHAQEAGAIAAIVYDDQFEQLIIMSKPRGHPDPLVSSVFVSQRSGMLLQQLLDLNLQGGVRVRLTDASPVEWVSLLMSMILGLLALGMTLASFWMLRSWTLWLSGQGELVGGVPGAAGGARSGQGDGGLPASTLRALPVFVYDSSQRDLSQPPSRSSSLPNMPMGVKGDLEGGAVVEEDPKALASKAGQGGCGDCGGSGSSASSEYDMALPPGVHAGETKRMCIVCLEGYHNGEKIRVLPCHHRFHMQCIDQWLTSRRCCPMCKHDASKPLFSAVDDASAVTAAIAPVLGPRVTLSQLATALAGVRRAMRSRRVREHMQLVGAESASQTTPEVIQTARPSGSHRAAVQASLMSWLGLVPASTTTATSPRRRQEAQSQEDVTHPLLGDMPLLGGDVEAGGGGRSAAPTTVGDVESGAMGLQIEGTPVATVVGLAGVVRGLAVGAAATPSNSVPIAIAHPGPDSSVRGARVLQAEHGTSATVVGSAVSEISEAEGV